MNLETILQTLKEKGCRKTPLRTALLEVLLENHKPISVPELIIALRTKGQEPSQSTVYRQLDTLIEHKVVDPVTINPKLQLFEIAHEHHHHFVCDNCEEVQDLYSDEVESAFHQFEQQLKARGLNIQKHELTFFGECQSCH